MEAFALVYALVAQYDGWNPVTMMRIVGCESGFRNDAVSWSNDYGLFQLHDDPRGLDPILATEIAHEKFQVAAAPISEGGAGDGYRPWVSSEACWE